MHVHFGLYCFLTIDDVKVVIFLLIFFGFIEVKMQAQKEAPPDMQCRDKFLLQNIIAKAGATPKDITPDELFYVQSTASFLATTRYGSVTPVPPSVLSHGIGDSGALTLTKVGSGLVIQISAAFMLFFSVFGKFGAIFASIALQIIAALNCVFFGCISSVGPRHLQFCNLNSFRTKFILGLSFLIGLSLLQFFREKHTVDW
ncbi:putative xanthine/uracil/vitamin C permease [Helianthus anomalus]